MHGIEVGVKATRFIGPVVQLQIVGPTKANGLIPEFGFNGERSGCGAERRPVPNPMNAAGKPRVVERVADYRDVLVGGLLIEAVRQQAIVLEVAHARKQSGGHMTILIANDRFIDLDLIGAADFGVVGLETGRVGVIVVANDRTIRVEGAGFEDAAAVAVADYEVEPHAP